MAKTTTKTTTTKASKTAEVATTPKKKEKKFAADDAIPCRSITNGELLMVGDKTGMLYRWADYGDVTDVEYQDLIYATRSSRTSFVRYPRFIILDDDFVAQNKEIAKIYESLYEIGDLRNIINLPINKLEGAIAELPTGVRESLKGICATMINNGELDSMKKISKLDEIFDTEMLRTLVDE